MFPLIASSISASVGCGFFDSSATADMICPDWQYPHCGTSSSIHARCTGCDASVDSPSMVITFFPATLEIGVMQERVASPLMCTVHAPQRAMPQPNFVPVMSRVSRRTHSSGICGSTSTVVDLPFSVKVTAIATSLRAGRYRTTMHRWMEMCEKPNGWVPRGPFLHLGLRDRRRLCPGDQARRRRVTFPCPQDHMECSRKFHQSVTVLFQNDEAPRRGIDPQSHSRPVSAGASP